MHAIELLYPNTWSDYSLIDSGDGARLERFGKYIFRRPDPQALWKPKLSAEVWNKVDGWYERGGYDDEKGTWFYSNGELKRWVMTYGDLKFWAQPTSFKHIGVFPEQGVHWDWMSEKILAVKGSKPSVLNLFGYTGIATLACAKSGAFVTHVDASRPSINLANENAQLSGIPKESIRWILEDVLAFVKREVRRGSKYDAIIMDPPAFGHGAKGELWKFSTHFPELIGECSKLLTNKPMFVIINAYAVSVSALFLHSMLDDYLGSLGGKITCGELCLKQEKSDRVLSTGIFGRYENN